MRIKGRLEEIKFKFNNTIDVMLYMPYEDVKFLIEQAERVQELEQQNKRYHEALEFYADRENYEPEHYDPDTHDYTSIIDHDKGATARKVLGESK